MIKNQTKLVNLSNCCAPEMETFAGYVFAFVQTENEKGRRRRCVKY